MASISAKKTAGKQTRDIDRTRSMILDSAIKEFAQAGMEGSRVDTISKNAGVNKAMIYYIFGSKQELYLAALEMLFEEKTKGVDPPPENSNVVELLSNYFDAFARNPEIVRMMLHDIASGANALRELKKRRPDLYEPFHMVSALMSGWIDAGVIKEIDTDKAVLLSIVIMMSLISITPHVDLIADPGTPAHESLSDPEAWKLFLGSQIVQLLANK